MAKPPENQPNPSANLWDAMFGEIGRAVADIREKVVLEPWFGPSSGGNDHSSHSPATQSVAEELGWVKSDDSLAPEFQAPDRWHDFDM